MARILIIDDDEQVRRYLRKILEAQGHEVVAASDGKLGIELCREEPTDLIITDIFMPEKEGLETIGELRRDYPDVKIIAISGGGRTGNLDFLPLADWPRSLALCAPWTSPSHGKRCSMPCRRCWICKTETGDNSSLQLLEGKVCSSSATLKGSGNTS